MIPSIRSINPLDNEVLVGIAQKEVARIAAVFARKLRGGDEMAQELVQAGWEALADCARSWEPSKGTWAVYVRVVVRPAMRRALHVQRAPVSGSPWRAHKWSGGLCGVEVDPDAAAHTSAETPERVLVGRRFINTMLGMLADTANAVPQGRLGMRVVLGEDSKAVAHEAGVSIATVMRAVTAFRDAVQDNGALCAFVMEEKGASWLK